MKQFFLHLLLLSNFVSYSQKEDSSDLKNFNDAINYYNKKNLDSALAIWSRIVDAKIGTQSFIYGNSFFNIGIIHLQKKENEKAKELFKRILTSELRDSDETGELMEPHTNYKHKSAINLARLYYQDSNFREALAWIWKADTLYRYWGFEGSATNVGKKQSALLSWKIELLNKLDKKEDAIYEALLELLCSGNSEGFFSEEESEFLAMIDKQQFKSEFDKAVDQLQIKTIDSSNWIAHFDFRGFKYDIPISKVLPPRELPHYWKMVFIKQDQIVDKKMVLDYIKARNFYKQL